MLGFESRGAGAPRVRADRRPRPLDVGHAVPDGVQEGGARRQRRQRQPARSWCWPTCRASTARPSRCGGGSSSSAPRSAAPSPTSAGPIVFVVISRYHGGAFVVFSRTLSDNMQVAALEGTYASVIGGAPAAAVVFAREVDQRTRKDPRVQALERELAAADDEGKRRAAAAPRRPRQVGAVGEARRGGRRVRPHPQRPARRARRLGRPDHPGQRPAAVGHVGARDGDGEGTRAARAEGGRPSRRGSGARRAAPTSEPTAIVATKPMISRHTHAERRGRASGSAGRRSPRAAPTRRPRASASRPASRARRRPPGRHDSQQVSRVSPRCTTFSTDSLALQTMLARRCRRSPSAASH